MALKDRFLQNYNNSFPAVQKFTKNKSLGGHVTSSELGVKRTCPKCSAKFYDLNANPIKCPKCGHSYKKEQAEKARKQAFKKAVVMAAIPQPAKPKGKKKEDIEDDLPPEELEGAGEVEDIEDLETIDDSEVISLEEVEEHTEEKEHDPDSDDADDETFLEDLERQETGRMSELDELVIEEEEDEEGEEE